MRDFIEKHSSLILITLLIGEYGLFRTYVLRDIAGLYPFGWDQPSYLIESYMRYENILRYGLWGGFKASQPFSSAASLLFTSQAALYFLLFGASRFAALNINFIYWALLQIFAYRVVFSMTRSVPLAFMFIGLMLTIDMPFFNAGGLLDFRIDFVAACLYGMVVCAVMRSGVFLDKKWTMIATGLSIWLILMRYFTILYFAGIFGILFIYYLIQVYKNQDPAIRLSSQQRLKYLSFSALVTLLCVSPIFWWAKEAIYSYYIVGHVIGPEKYFRASVLGLQGLMEHISFYPDVFIQYHAGRVLKSFALLVICLIGIKGILSFFKKNTYKSETDTISYSDGFLFIIPATMMPLIILTFDVAKSYVVPGIVTIPFIWIFFLSFLYVIRTNIAVLQLRNLNGTLAVLILLGGFSYFSGNLVQHASILQRPNVREVGAMYDKIAQYFNQTGTPVVLFSADAAADYYGKDLLKVIGYENYGRLINAHATPMGGSFFSIDDDGLKTAVNKSHVFIMNLYDDYPESIYPLNNSLKNKSVKLKSLAEMSMIPLSNHSFDTHHFRVYVKPDFDIAVTHSENNESKLVLTIPAVVANAAKEIFLKGDLNGPPLQGRYDLSAELVNIQQPLSLKHDYTMKNDHYSVKIPLPKWESDKPMIIALRLASQPDQVSTQMIAPYEKTILLKSGVWVKD